MPETATRRSKVIGTLVVIVPVSVALTGALDAPSQRSVEAALSARLAPLNLKPN